VDIFKGPIEFIKWILFFIFFKLGLSHSFHHGNLFIDSIEINQVCLKIIVSKFTPNNFVIYVLFIYIYTHVTN
jgi:hypothetical protein